MMRMGRLLVSLNLALGAAAASGGEGEGQPVRPPQILEDALNRLDCVKGRIEYERQFFGREESLHHAVTITFTAEETATDMWIDARGESTHSRVLREQGNRWTLVGDSSLMVSLMPEGTIGLRDEINYRRFGLDVPIPAAARVVGYSMKRDGDEIVVLEHLRIRDNWTFDRSYWIDPNLGGAITRIELGSKDNVSYERVLTYAERDGLWMPESWVDFANNAGRPSHITRVERFEMDPPDVPDRLTPEFIGVESGTQLSVVADATRGRPDLRWGRTPFWDGQQAVPREAFFRGLQDGTYSLGPRVSAEWAADDSAAPAASTESRRIAASQPRQRTWTLWEAEVAAWIEEHPLRHEQVQRAWTIHADCVLQAEQHSRRQFARAATAKQPEQSQRREKELGERIDRIHSKLMARLGALLTRNQANQSAK